MLGVADSPYISQFIKSSPGVDELVVVDLMFGG